MGHLTEHDLRSVATFLRGAAPGTPVDPLPRRLLADLRDLIGADDAEYFELRRADRAVIADTRSHDWPDPPWIGDALAAHGHENPLNWRRWRPSDGAMRLSAMVSRRDLQRLAFYNEFLRPLRLTDTLKVWISSSSASAACVQLWRHGGQFSRRDEDVLAVVHSHLIRVRAMAIGRRSITSEDEASLTVREAEIVMWAMAGVGDADIADRLGLSEATVGKHLEHAYDKLGVHSRTEALWRLSRAPQPPEPS